MGRKRQAEKDIGPDVVEDEAGNHDAGTWTPASPEEIAQREVVKITRKRKNALTSSAFPVFDFAAQAAKPIAKPAVEEPPTTVMPSSSDTASVSEAVSAPEPETAVADNPLLKFMKKAGSWDCPVCLLNNEAVREKCIACEADKPASADTKSPSLSSKLPASSALNPKAAEFKFGGSPSEAAPTFKFGAAAGDATSFTFGAPASTTGVPSTIPFKFGTLAGDQPAQSFSSLSGEASNFSFLSTSTNPAAENPPSPSAFQFSSTAVASFAEPTEPTREPLAEPVASGEENDEIVLKVPIVAYKLTMVEKDVDGKVDKRQTWLECGNGDLHVNTYPGDDGDRHFRLVLRMEKTHRLALNVPIFKGMVFERSNDRMIRLTTVAGDDPTQFDSYLLKTKTKDESDSLLQTLKQLTT